MPSSGCIAVDSSDAPALAGIQQLAAEKRGTRCRSRSSSYVDAVGDAEMKENYALILVNGALADAAAGQPGLDGAADLAAQGRRDCSVPAAGSAPTANYILGLATCSSSCRKLDQPIMKAKSCEHGQTEDPKLAMRPRRPSPSAPRRSGPDAVERYKQIAAGSSRGSQSLVKAFCK